MLFPNFFSKKGKKWQPANNSIYRHSRGSGVGKNQDLKGLMGVLRRISQQKKTILKLSLFQAPRDLVHCQKKIALGIF
jgi:hypothetical protein